MTETIKYGKTPHLPFSPGVHKTDRQWRDLRFLEGKQVVVTEKLDGENTTLYTHAIHARSLSSGHHESREWVKRFHASFAHHIPEGMRISGENLYAYHSIHYQKLPTYFMVFNIFHGDYCLEWDSVVEWCQMLTDHRKKEEEEAGRVWNPLLGLYTVPVLYEGLFDNVRVQQCYTGQSLYGGVQEGYVVRNREMFKTEQFSHNIAKFVRKDHVNSGEKHWMLRPVVANKLDRS